MHLLKYRQPLRRRQRGDTFIEVLFATAVFSMLAITTLTIMNQGTTNAERSLEITMVRQAMDAQADTLRFIHDSFVAAYQPGLTTYSGPAEAWYQIDQMLGSSGNSHPTLYFPSDNPAFTATINTPPYNCPDIHGASGNNYFVVDPKTASYIRKATAFPAKESPAPPTNLAQLVYSGSTLYSHGIWIQAAKTPAHGTTPGYIDFAINACWAGAGGGVPLTTGTIVRLYEPL